eukprot:10258014-Heterocapsa_arctica.AAC.1
MPDPWSGTIPPPKLVVACVACFTISAHEGIWYGGVVGAAAGTAGVSAAAGTGAGVSAAAGTGAG